MKTDRASAAADQARQSIAAMIEALHFAEDQWDFTRDSPQLKAEIDPIYDRLEALYRRAVGIMQLHDAKREDQGEVM